MKRRSVKQREKVIMEGRRKNTEDKEDVVYNYKKCKMKSREVHWKIHKAKRRDDK